MLRACDVAPHRLKVEITESAIMTDPDVALEILTHLHNLGVKISIDDFGTGYSSLSYIGRLPADELKIDKSFVMNMTCDEGDAFIVRSVIELGHNLGMEVVAEGVESQEIWSRLTSMGCDLAQGAYLSLALPAEQFTEKFANDPCEWMKSVG
jgi:EAL domain-containing protein (putative c-di-GMP-specific phosphodiesterase class I)